MAFDDRIEIGVEIINVKFFAVLLSAFATLSTVCGGLIAVRGRKRVHLLLGIGAGMLLGATFFDLLPESIAAAQSQGWDFRSMLLVMLLGFLGFYVAERVLILHSCAESGCSNEAHRRLGRMSTIGLIAHSILDGATIGAATLVSWQEGILVALAGAPENVYEGPGSVYQTAEGDLMFKLFANTTADRVSIFFHVLGQNTGNPGEIVPRDEYYSLEATAMNGVVWRGEFILHGFNQGVGKS